MRPKRAPITLCSNLYLLQCPISVNSTIQARRQACPWYFIPSTLHSQSTCIFFQLYFKHILITISHQSWWNGFQVVFVLLLLPLHTTTELILHMATRVISLRHQPYLVTSVLYYSVTWQGIENRSKPSPVLWSSELSLHGLAFSSLHHSFLAHQSLLFALWFKFRKIVSAWELFFCYLCQVYFTFQKHPMTSSSSPGQRTFLNHLC
jgi:hypothetical protein